MAEAEANPVSPTASTPLVGRELVLTRTFDAPRALVFKAWTDPEQLARWWGPKGFTNPVCEVDARPGGAIYIEMNAPYGTVYPMKGTVHEVDEPSRFVFTSSAMEDEQGDHAFEILNTITFTEQDGKTTLTLRAVVVKAVPAAAGPISGMSEGWSQSLDRLADLLAHA